MKKLNKTKESTLYDDDGVWRCVTVRLGVTTLVEVKAKTFPKARSLAKIVIKKLEKKGLL